MSLSSILSCISLTTFSLCTWASAQTGPLVGTVKPDRAWFLYRPGSQEKTLRLSVLDAKGTIVGRSQSVSSAVNDYVAKFEVSGLTPNSAYTYRIEDLSTATPTLLAGPSLNLKFKTPLVPGQKGVVTAAFASCANATSESTWQRMSLLGVDQVFLMGDTPYVDVADLTKIRDKHRSFLESPFLASLIRSTPTAGIWDDHDFGLNNGNGINAASCKENTRRGFIEYRAHEQYGDGSGGVYHKVNLGAMEVFLLDPRWFSQTAPSPVDPSQITCFGASQWEWLLQGLKNSKAPFKVLAFGAIWQDKKNKETDDMFTYWYERDRLFDFIRDEKIPGVMLLGGDIHLSRHLIHPQRVAYDLHDFITSPTHNSVIPSLNVPHPDLEWASTQPGQFLTLTADTQSSPAKLTARFMSHTGAVLRELTLPYTELTPREGQALGRGLRAWWNFDADFKNQSLLGSRVDAESVNKASLALGSGIRGGAASFDRTKNQFLHVKRSFLDDNSAAHTVSLWAKPNSLPAHGSADRHFLMESTLGSAIENTAGYGISLGFRASDSPNLVNLELHTIKLNAASSIGAAPTPTTTGPFPCLLDRSLFTNRWAHVVLVSEMQGLRLYVDGKEVAYHAFKTPGPVAEMGGLIIGGHRQGIGRNYDGLLDEIAVWQRVLSSSEVNSLYNSGSPNEIPTTVEVVQPK